MIIDADDTSETWKGSDHHTFLTREGEPDPVNIVIKLKEMIDDARPTCATLYPKHYLTEAEYDALLQDHIYLAGSWSSPFADSYTKIINPKYVHMNPKFSDVRVVCECGAICVNPQNIQDGRAYEHEDCPVYHRQKAYSEVNRRRASISRTMLRLDYNVADISDRLTYRKNSPSEPLRKSLNIDVMQEKEIGKKLRANTLEKLIWKHPSPKLGKLYDISGRQVLRILRNETSVTPRKAHHARLNSD